ncbi:hypothetical protein BGZ61DRAFT_437890, partial [Ilyonectria robusta]|uniref:uncharacterized protein n=1 Tax=Ilyonectria robusta TaxID=1079257 RepID=UPI001E8E8EC6
MTVGITFFFALFSYSFSAGGVCNRRRAYGDGRIVLSALGTLRLLGVLGLWLVACSLQRAGAEVGACNAFCTAALIRTTDRKKHRHIHVMLLGRG